MYIFCNIYFAYFVAMHINVGQIKMPFVSRLQYRLSIWARWFYNNLSYSSSMYILSFPPKIEKHEGINFLSCPSIWPAVAKPHYRHHTTIRVSSHHNKGHHTTIRVITPPHKGHHITIRVSSISKKFRSEPDILHKAVFIPQEAATKSWAPRVPDSPLASYFWF